ncbi:MAG: NAD(P)-dependent oxidoreductase [Zoogloea sp.]|nr:NAD(P)-dependent oxidoreductase [Zoogloea sp.]
MTQEHIAFIGLGNMGAPMARLLIAAGFPVTLFNRTRSRAEALAAEAVHARVADSPREAVAAGGVVVTMLANDAALLEVALGQDGFIDALGSGGLHISMSTVSPDTSRRLAAEHAARGSLFLAAPVFGRPEAAAARKLWICQSGDAVAKARAHAYLQAMGQGVQDFGEEPGAANIVKLSGNFLIASAIESMAEALALVEKNGIDRAAVMTFLGNTLFACPVYQNYGRMIAGRSYEPAGFKLELGMKDLRLLREVAEDCALPMPQADVVHARMLSALAKGRGQLDWTATELCTAEDGALLPPGGPASS